MLAYGFQIAELDLDGGLRSVSESSARLWPNSHEYRYAGRVHEEIRYRSEPIPSGQWGAFDLVAMDHIGNDEWVYASKQKDERNLALLALSMLEEPGNAWHRFYLAKQHHKMRRHVLARRAAFEALELGGLTDAARCELQHLTGGPSCIRGY